MAYLSNHLLMDIWVVLFLLFFNLGFLNFSNSLCLFHSFFLKTLSLWHLLYHSFLDSSPNSQTILLKSLLLLIPVCISSMSVYTKLHSSLLIFAICTSFLASITICCKWSDTLPLTCKFEVPTTYIISYSGPLPPVFLFIYLFFSF